MTEDLNDEVKVFRKTDNEEAAENGIDPDTLAGMQDVGGCDGDRVPTGFPIASSSTGSLMPPGLAHGGLAPAFHSPYPYFSSPYQSPNILMALMSPQYQVTQNLLMSAMANYTNNTANLAMQKAVANSNQQNNSMTPSFPAKIKSATKENRESQKDRIKKPLNAFMIFMQEMRPKLLQEEHFANMQSAELNRELGKRWTALGDDVQKVYYEKYRQGKIEHEKLYPGWSARDNYTVRRRRNIKASQVHQAAPPKPTYSGGEINEPKKCRALYGINNQAQWCRHCKRKKRCLLVRNHDNDDNSSHDGSPTTPSSNVDLPDVHNPLAPQPLPNGAMPLTLANLNLNEQHHVNGNQDVKAPLPMAPQQPHVMNPMMQPFGMPFSMYPFGFPPLMGMPMPQHLIPQPIPHQPIKTEGYGMTPEASTADIKP